MFVHCHAIYSESSQNLTGNLTVWSLEVHFVVVCEALLSLVEPGDSALLAATGGATATGGVTATGDVAGSS